MMPSRWQRRFAHGRLLGPLVGRIAQIQLLTLEMGGRQPVGDENYLPVGRRLQGPGIAYIARAC